MRRSYIDRVALLLTLAATVPAGCYVGSPGSSSWSYVITNDSETTALVRLHFPGEWWPVVEVPAGITTAGDAPQPADEVDVLADDCAVVASVDWDLGYKDARITIDAGGIDARLAEETDWTRVNDPDRERPWSERCADSR